MKILHVITNLSSEYGGPVKVCKELCESLANEGDDVTIFTTNLDYPHGEMDVPLNTCVKQNGYKVWYFKTQLKSFVFSWQYAKALRKNISKFDLVHIHGLYRFPHTIAAYYARKYNVPYIIRPHGSLDPFLYNQKKNRFFKRIYECLIENRNLNKASALHFTSDDEMTLIKPLKLKAPSVIVPNGLDTSKYINLPVRGQFREKFKLENKIIILHFGRINFKKGLDILVKAFAKVAIERDDICLVIAGPDNENYSEQVKSWLKQEGVYSKTVFTGMLHGSAALEVLRDADIFALPSYTENFGMAAVEAMCSGLPVIVSDQVNIWRDIEQAGAGLVTTCSPDKLAECFVKLLDNKSLRKKLGVAGQRLVEEKYSWGSVTGQMRDVYQDVIKKHSSLSQE